MKIAIAGYGREGRANLIYLQAKFPEAKFTIFDEAPMLNDVPAGVSTMLGKGAFEKIQGFDLVMRTASLPPRKIGQAEHHWSSTREFFAECPVPIIGVTGTKGKGTTCSIIQVMFEAAGKTVHLVGNIGVPALGVLPIIDPGDIVIYEMSSFQLWDLEVSPHVAVITPIEPDHLNVHEDMDEYVLSKQNIRKYQTANDFCTYNPDSAYSRQIALSNDLSKAVRYAVSDDGGVYVRDGNFYQNEQKICSVSSLQVPGMHNVENACAAITVARYYGLDNQTIQAGLESFHGLPHHIEFIREVDGVKYYDDSFSSAPSATVAAVKSFDEPQVLILGGIYKKADLTHLIQAIKTHDMRRIITIGTVRQQLKQLFADSGITAPITVSEAKTMREIVALARQSAQSGDVVLLSPGHASFDMFKNFSDRGEQFRAEVEKL